MMVTVMINKKQLQILRGEKKLIKEKFNIKI